MVEGTTELENHPLNEIAVVSTSENDTRVPVVTIESKNNFFFLHQKHCLQWYSQPRGNKLRILSLEHSHPLYFWPFVLMAATQVVMGVPKSSRPESMTIRSLTLLLIAFLPGHHPVTLLQVKKFQIMPRLPSHSNRQKMRTEDGYPSPTGWKQTNGKNDSTRRKGFWQRSGPCSLLWLFSESVCS